MYIQEVASLEFCDGNSFRILIDSWFNILKKLIVGPKLLIQIKQQPVLDLDLTLGL